MTPEEFSELRRAADDFPSILPTTPDRLMASCLYRLEKLMDKCQKNPDDSDLHARLSEVKFLLSVEISDGKIIPTHYYD